MLEKARNWIEEHPSILCLGIGGITAIGFTILNVKYIKLNSKMLEYSKANLEDVNEIKTYLLLTDSSRLKGVK